MFKIAEKIHDWNGNKGGVDIKGIYQISVQNPKGYMDYWGIYDFVKAEDIIKKGVVFHGIVTPEGKWISSPEFFYTVSEENEKAWNKWKDDFYKILSKYKEGYLIALVDCHM